MQTATSRSRRGRRRTAAPWPARKTSASIAHALWWALLVCSACDPGAPAPELDLPRRADDARGGTEVARDLRALDLEAREQRIFAEIAGGNVPTWLRQLRRVDMTGEVDGREHQVTFWVTPDYLSVGSDSDYLHVPLSPQTAQRIADLLDGSFPTPRMVDAIWAAANVRLTPQRIPPVDSIETVRTVEYFERHSSLIQAQRMIRRVPPDAFVAGHKKDIVLSATLAANPGKVAVYGQHRADGRPVQSLSTVVVDGWVYYNHGVRLVHRRVLLDGVSTELASVLRDPAVAPLLSDGGVIARPRYPLLRDEAVMRDER